MAGGEMMQGLEGEKSLYDQNLQYIETQFGDDGFEDFKTFLETQAPQIQEKILKLFQVHKDNTDFRDWIDFEGLPYEAGLVADLEAEFPMPIIEEGGGVISSKAGGNNPDLKGQVERAEEKEDTAEARETELIAAEKLTNAQREKLKGLAIILIEKHGLNENEYNLDSIDGIDKFREYLKNNSHKLLQEAKSRSITEFNELYDLLQDLQGDNIVKVSISDFASDRAISTVTSGTNQSLAGDAALGDSEVTRIEGDTVYGSDGEIIDFSEVPPVMTLEGGFVVGELDKPVGRELKVERAELERELKTVEAERDTNQKRINSYESRLGQVKTQPVEAFESEKQQDLMIQRFAQEGDIGMVAKIEQAAKVGGEAVRSVIIEFFEGKITELGGKNTELSLKVADIERKLGNVGAKIEAQQRLYRERMRLRVERVKKTREFANELKVLRMESTLREAFSRVTESSPINLGNGNIITSINPDTLEMKGSFNVDLGDGGADDPRTRIIYSQVINKMLTGNTDGPIIAESSGNFSFMLDGERVDAMKFENYITNQAGDMAFQTRSINNLFGNTPTGNTDK